MRVGVGGAGRGNKKENEERKKVIKYYQLGNNNAAFEFSLLKFDSTR